MSIRFLIIEAYLHVLAFALIITGLIGLIGYLDVQHLTFHSLVLPLDSSLLLLLLGGLLLSAVYRARKLLKVLIFLLIITVIYSTIRNWLVGEPETNLSFISEFIRVRTALIITSLISSLAFSWSLESHLTKRRAYFTGAGIILLSSTSLLSDLFWAPEATSLRYDFSSIYVVDFLSILLSISIILLVPRSHQKLSSPGRIPVLAGLLGVILTSITWYLLSLQTISFINQQSDILLAKVQSSTERALSNRLALIQRMSERWEALGSLPTQAYWQQEAKSYLRDFPNLQWVGVFDSEIQPYWLVGRTDKAAEWLPRFRAEQNQQVWFQQTLASRSTSLSPVFTLPDNPSTYVLLASPLNLPNQPPRLIAAGLSLQGIMRDLIGTDYDQFVLALFQGNQPIYRSALLSNQDLKSRPINDRNIILSNGKSWKLVAYVSNPAAFSTARLLSVLVMAFGLLLSFFLMLSQRLARIATERAKYLQQANKNLQASLESQAFAQALNQRIMEFTMDVLCSFDREGRFLEVSPSCLKLFGYSPEELIGRPYLELVLPEDRDLTIQEAQQLMTGRPTYNFRNRYRHKDGHVIYILWSADWSETDQVLFAVAHDITPLVQNEAFANRQRDILSLISLDRPLTEILTAICAMVEEFNPSTYCSILRLDRETQQIWTVVAPSLPKEYCQAIDGATVGPNTGSCGAAIFRRQPVLVADIESDPLWANDRDTALIHGLRSCWSFPLIAHNGQVQGTLAVYQPFPQTPSEDQLQQCLTVAQLAAIAFARSLDRQQLQDSEQRFRSLFTFNPDAVYSFDLQGIYQSMNSAGFEILDRQADQIIGKHFSDVVISEDLEKCQQHFDQACKGEAQHYEIRINGRNGQLFYLDVSKFPIVVNNKIVGVFGIAKDITQRKQITADLQQALMQSNKQAEQLRRLGNAAIATAELQDHQELVKYLVEQVRLTIRAHQAVISLTRCDDWSQSINAISLSDKYAAWKNYDELSTDEGIYTLICETNQPLVLTQEELEKHPRWRGFGDQADKHPPMRGWLAVPLFDPNGRNLGVLQLSDKEEGEFDDDDLAIAQQFAQMTVAVLENNRLLNEVLTAEQQLKEQLSFNSTITDCMAEGLLAVDERGKLAFANPTAQDWLAIDKSELSQQSLDQLLPLDLTAWNQGGVGNQGELKLKGRILQYEARPLVGPVAERGWVLVLHDVTAQRQVDQAMRERDQFFSLSLEMFCMVDLRGRFIQVNPAFAATLRYSTAELVGRPYLELVDLGDRSQIATTIRRLKAGLLIHDLVIRVWDKAGELHWLQISAALGDDRVIYCVARDVTEQRAIQEQILQQNLLLRMAGQTAKLGGWSVELPSREVIWSPETFSLLGFTDEDEPDLEEALSLYPPAERALVTKALEDCIQQGISFDFDVAVHNTSGFLLDARVTGQAVRDETGAIVRISGAFQDVSDRKRAQREAQRLADRLRTTLESITDGFYTLDENWRFSYLNQEGAQQLGVNVEETLGQMVWTAFPGSYESELGHIYRQAIATGEAAHFETYYEPFGRWFEVHAYPSEDGLAVYFRDVSERRQTEQNLRITLRELERSNQELQEFAFVASHDLQEPLRKIQAFSDRLIARTSNLDDESQDYLRRMASAAGRMQTLIIDLLNYSRVNTRGLPLQPLSLDQVLDDVLVDMEASLDQASAIVERQPLPTIQGDAGQFRQVFQNLLSNALKFQSADNQPLIQIYSELTEAGQLRLCIADNGIGFDEKYLDRIFNPFQRLHSRDAYAGTGIGLAIVKKIIERHGATITAKSIPGQGSVFFITFPVTEKDFR